MHHSLKADRRDAIPTAGRSTVRPSWVSLYYRIQKVRFGTLSGLVQLVRPARPRRQERRDGRKTFEKMCYIAPSAATNLYFAEVAVQRPARERHSADHPDCSEL